MEGRSRISTLTLRGPSGESMSMCSGIMWACAPRTPRMADSRSWVNAPTVTPVLTILKELSGEASVATTSAVVMGIETGPAPRTGWPHARICLGSTQVTVQVAETSRSPRMSCMLTAEPGTSVESASEPAVESGVDCADEARPENVALVERLVAGSGGLLLPEADGFWKESDHHERGVQRLKAHVGLRTGNARQERVLIC